MYRRPIDGSVGGDRRLEVQASGSNSGTLCAFLLNLILKLSASTQFF